MTPPDCRMAVLFNAALGMGTNPASALIRPVTFLRQKQVHWVRPVGEDIILPLPCVIEMVVEQ